MDKIVYFWLLLFLIPIPSAIFYFDSSVRNYNYIWVFIFLVYIFRTGILSNTKCILFSNKAILLFFIGVLASFIYSALSQYYSFHVPARDFSIFDTMLQEALLGNWGFSTAVGYYHFATHQNYILLLILPIYALVHNPVCLIIINPFIIWFAGVMLWKISRLYCNRFYSLMLVLSFYLSPHLGIGNLSFYPEMFYPCMLFLIIYAYLKEQLLWLITFVVLFFSIKEDAILYAIAIIPFLLFRKEYLKAFILSCLITVFAIINFQITAPYFLAKSHLLLEPTLQFWSLYGHSKMEILSYIYRHPVTIILNMFNYNSGFWSTYFPFLFIPLFCLSVALASLLPLGLFLSVSNTDTVIYHLGGYYPIVLISLCFLGMLHFMIKYKNHKLLSRVSLIVLLTSPLWGVGSLSFYYINWTNVRSFKELYAFLYYKYPNSAVCPGSSIYPWLNIKNFASIEKYDNSGNVMHFLTQSNCIVMFSAVGDNYPYSNDSVSYMINYAKTHNNCGSIGQFYYCKN